MLGNEEYMEACLTHRELTGQEHDDAVNHQTELEAVPWKR